VGELPEDCYAAYYLGTWIDGPYGAPVDGRTYPLWKIAGAITGLYANPPILSTPIPGPRPFPEPYVCIGVEASTPRKGWHYPQGWEIVVNVLQKTGLRVICIDRHTLSRAGAHETRMPANAEDMTGNIPLLERAKILTHAKCFIGLSTGLSWIAHAVGCPVVVICGFAEDYHEFPTPYRVCNRLACHGCLHDKNINFLAENVICPYYQGTKRELECSRSIHPDMVLTAAFAAMGL
jgi:autotransporter strand-loop-strand O-heptosyltransferase